MIIPLFSSYTWRTVQIKITALSNQPYSERNKVQIRGPEDRIQHATVLMFVNLCPKVRHVSQFDIELEKQTFVKHFEKKVDF